MKINNKYILIVYRPNHEEGCGNSISDSEIFVNKCNNLKNLIENLATYKLWELEDRANYYAEHQFILIRNGNIIFANTEDNYMLNSKVDKIIKLASKEAKSIMTKRIEYEEKEKKRQSELRHIKYKKTREENLKKKEQEEKETYLKLKEKFETKT
jgi:Tfp pilus assembly protein PilZ